MVQGTLGSVMPTLYAENYVPFRGVSTMLIQRHGCTLYIIVRSNRPAEYRVYTPRLRGRLWCSPHEGYDKHGLRSCKNVHKRGNLNTLNDAMRQCT